MLTKSSDPVVLATLHHFNENSNFGFLVDTEHYYRRGRVGVWKRTESGFVHQQNLSVDIDGHRFGTTIRTSADGTVLFVGAPGNCDGMHEIGGKIYVYRLKKDYYQIEGSFVSSDDYHTNNFGTIFDVTPDGEHIIVGSPTDSLMSGRVRIYSKTKAGIWKEHQNLSPRDMKICHFGRKVEMKDGYLHVAGLTNFDPLREENSNKETFVKYKRRKGGSFTLVQQSQ